MQVLTGRPHQPPQQQQLEEMPPIPLSQKELMATPVNELKRMLQDRKIDITGAVLLLLLPRMLLPGRSLPRYGVLARCHHFNN